LDEAYDYSEDEEEPESLTVYLNYFKRSISKFLIGIKK